MAKQSAYLIVAKRIIAAAAKAPYVSANDGHKSCVLKDQKFSAKFRQPRGSGSLTRRTLHFEGSIGVFVDNVSTPISMRLAAARLAQAIESVLEGGSDQSRWSAAVLLNPNTRAQARMRVEVTGTLSIDVVQ